MNGCYIIWSNIKFEHLSNFPWRWSYVMTRIRKCLSWHFKPNYCGCSFLNLSPSYYIVDWAVAVCLQLSNLGTFVRNPVSIIHSLLLLSSQINTLVIAWNVRCWLFFQLCFSQRNMKISFIEQCSTEEQQSLLNWQ